jgi:hypothetical protein
MIRIIVVVRNRRRTANCEMVGEQVNQRIQTFRGMNRCSIGRGLGTHFCVRAVLVQVG